MPDDSFSLAAARELAVLGSGEFAWPEVWATRGNSATVASHLRHYATVAAHLQPADSVIDVGCGCGLATRIYRLHVGGRVVAVDRPPAITVARNYYPMPGVEYHSIEFSRNELPEGEFDVAIMLEVLEHLQAEVGAAVLQQIAARLRQNGRLYFSVPLLSRGNRPASEVKHHVRDFADPDAALAEATRYLFAGQSAHLVYMDAIAASGGGGRCAQL